MSLNFEREEGGRGGERQRERECTHIGIGWFILEMPVMARNRTGSEPGARKPRQAFYVGTGDAIICSQGPHLQKKKNRVTSSEGYQSRHSNKRQPEGQAYSPLVQQPALSTS